MPRRSATVTQAGSLPALIDERGAYELYGHILEDKELRKARVAGKLSYYQRKNKIMYDAGELEQYVAKALKEDYVPCRENPSSDSDDIGSIPSEGPIDSTVFGMTRELERSAADRLRQEYLEMQKSHSRRSSSKKVRARRETQET